jgi:hypothetical protein
LRRQSDLAAAEALKRQFENISEKENACFCVILNTEKIAPSMRRFFYFEKNE